MALYVSAFGFRTPYQVLISDEFLVEAYKQKDVDILKMVGTTVQGEVKPSECLWVGSWRGGDIGAELFVAGGRECGEKG